MDKTSSACRHWLVAGLFVLVLGSLGFGIYAWSFADRVAFLPPLLDQPLALRQDTHGRGTFGAPRSGRRHHRGVDLEAPVGTPVRAVKGGWVVEARRDRGMGNYVEVAHGGGLSTLYAHLLRLDVRPGAHVRQGQLLGLVGKTGNARARDIAPHLHFEVHQDGRPIDPVNNYLKPYFKRIDDGGE